MDVTAEDFRRHYEILSDEALLEIDPNELVEMARNCLNDEIARRGLNEAPEESGPQEADSPRAAGPASGDELICIVEYDFLDEAELARGLLEAAEITVQIESEPGVARLMVPPGSAEQALRLLTEPLSDEELAAQAEAAGLEDEESVEPEEDHQP